MLIRIMQHHESVGDLDVLDIVPTKNYYPQLDVHAIPELSSDYCRILLQIGIEIKSEKFEFKKVT